MGTDHVAIYAKWRESRCRCEKCAKAVRPERLCLVGRLEWRRMLDQQFGLVAPALQGREVTP